MSYTASPWSAQGNNFATFYPTTPMYFDLVAIEGMYGQRAFNTGNNTYTFNDGTKYWQAINDTGGRDKILYHGAESSTINLNPGTFSSISEAISFHRPNGATVTSRATVTIGPNVVIEDATGGNGSDTLIGNAANNILSGGNGNDTLNGSGGYDYLMGGAGNDRLFGSVGSDKLSGGAGGDHFYFNTALNASTNRDTITDYNVLQDTLHLENAIFTRLAVQAHLNPAYFRVGSHAVDRNDYIVYNRGTGGLFYDPNGNLAGGQVQFAVLLNKPVLTASEFAVY
jgi:serralysin